MSSYEDTLLAARFAALAPEPLPGNWDDVLDRAGAVRSRRHGLGQSLWRGGRRHKLVVALAVAVLVAVVGAAAYGTVRVLFLDRAFIGLPPVGATPSAPESGELVLRSYGVAHGVRTHTWLYADGRLITLREFHTAAAAIPEGANEHSSGYLEQKLTTEGVALLRTEALSTGLFEHDLELRFGSVQPCFNFVDVRNGGQLVGVEWGGAQCGQPPGGGSASPAATREQESALRHLVDRVAYADAWLPGSAWETQTIRAYVASRYALCFFSGTPIEASEILSLLPRSAADLLNGHAFDQHVERTNGPDSGCAGMSTEEARGIAADLDRAGFERWGDPEVLRYHIPGSPAAGLGLQFEPYLPHGEFTCSSCG